MRGWRHCILLLFALGALSHGLRGQQRVCYFGDSITEGWMEGELRAEAAFPALTDSILDRDFRPVVALYRGTGGTTTDDALDQIDAVMRLGAVVIVIGFGSNDMYIWGRNPAPRVPIARFRANLRLLVSKIQGTGLYPVLLGMPPLIESRFYASGADSTLYAPYGGAAALHARYDQAIAEIAGERQCPIVSIADAFAGDSALLGFDGVHPLPAGHRRIAEHLAPVVAAQLDRRYSAPPLTDLAVWPNPFAPASTPYCTFSFAAEGRREFHLVISDMCGRVVWRRTYWSTGTGTYFIPWDGRDRTGTRVAPGAYMLYIQAYRFLAQRGILVR